VTEHPLLQITTPACLKVEAFIALVSHNCIVQILHDRAVITFPPGTIREEIPLHVHDRRYRIVLADGWELMEQVVGWIGKSVLYYAG